LEEVENWYPEDQKNMSFATIGDMAGRRKENVNENITMADDHGGLRAPPFDREDSLSHPWYSVKHWGKKAWLFLALGVAIIIAVVVAVAVVVTRNNRYPDYSKLSYSLSETCKSSLIL